MHDHDSLNDERKITTLLSRFLIEILLTQGLL
nr:MAG TPA: hypothetical protein [Caudoviricetes sp.]